METPREAAESVPPLAPSDAGALARRLVGALPCARCGYNLEGLSIRGVCPECACPVRATVLSVVDPCAPLLQPIAARRVVAAGLMAWSVCALAAALLVWGLRVVELVPAAAAIGSWWRGSMATASVACLAVSCVGAAVVVRPHAGLPRWQCVAAAGAMAAYAALVVAHWTLIVGYDATRLPPYFVSDALDPTRHAHRLVVFLLASLAVLGLRPNLRMLAARSMMMRTGRVDRQTMLALLASMGMAAAGDLVALAAVRAGGAWEWGPTAAVLLIAVGSMLTTLCLAAIAVDAWRVRRVILQPAPTLRQVVRGGDEP